MKIKLILPLLFLLFVTSCKKNDDASPATVVGKWSLTKIRSKVTGAMNMDITLALSSSSYMQFNADGTGVSASAMDGQPLTTEKFTYKVNGTKITITSEDKTEVTEGELQTLTSTDLLIYSKESAGGTTSETWLTGKK
ncbi:lipocalin family protein [Flectobacillus roseus]